MKDIKDGTVLCMRVEDGKLPWIELSYKDVCSGCGSFVWISPATKQLIDSSEFPRDLICVECASELIGND